MDIFDDDAQSYTSGYDTPPLSPSKTVSTEGWSSPKTPASPYRTLGYLLSCDDGIHNGPEASLDSSPRTKFAARSTTFQLSGVPEFVPDVDTISTKKDVSEGDPSICVDEIGVNNDVSFPPPAGRLTPRISSPHEA